jgi:hypothetical protein
VAGASRSGSTRTSAGSFACIPERKIVQPYFSIGGGYAHGTDVIGTFNEGIFELGTGIRFIFGTPYLGIDAEWVNLTAGTFELSLGARF